MLAVVSILAASETLIVGDIVLSIRENFCNLVWDVSVFPWSYNSGLLSRSIQLGFKQIRVIVRDRF